MDIFSSKTLQPQSGRREIPPAALACLSGGCRNQYHTWGFRLDRIFSAGIPTDFKTRYGGRETAQMPSRGWKCSSLEKAASQERTRAFPQSRRKMTDQRSRESPLSQAAGYRPEVMDAKNTRALSSSAVSGCPFAIPPTSLKGPKVS